MIYDALKRAGHSLHAAPPPAATPLNVPHDPAIVPPTPRRSGAPNRRDPWPEMVALYYNIEALRTTDGAAVLQFLSSRPGEGTSSIAREYAAFAASEDANTTLLIDCNRRSTKALPGFGRAAPPSLAEIARAGDPLEAAVTASRVIPNLDEARLSDLPNSLLHTNGPVWSGVLDQARQRYRFTILDCPAVSTNPDSVVLSRACDGVVLVVEAETTRGPVVQATIQTIERFGGKVLGLVFNKRRFYIPRWIYRRL